MHQKRHNIFVHNFGEGRKNWEYLDFIMDMRVKYLNEVCDGDDYITDGDAFTSFVEQNAARWERTELTKATKEGKRYEYYKRSKS